MGVPIIVVTIEIRVTIYLSEKASGCPLSYSPTSTILLRYYKMKKGINSGEVRTLKPSPNTEWRGRIMDDRSLQMA